MKIEIVRFSTGQYAIRRTQKFLWWTRYSFFSTASGYWWDRKSLEKFCLAGDLDSLRARYAMLTEVGEPIEQQAEGRAV